MSSNTNNISAEELNELLKKYRSLRAKLGGLKRNPKKGFGSGDNARKAALLGGIKIKKCATWHIKKYRSLRAKLGGLKRNPKKGFGSGDNVRKSALARWHKN